MPLTVLFNIGFDKQGESYGGESSRSTDPRPQRWAAWLLGWLEKKESWIRQTLRLRVWSLLGLGTELPRRFRGWRVAGVLVKIFRERISCLLGASRLRFFAQKRV